MNRRHLTLYFTGILLGCGASPCHLPASPTTLQRPLMEDVYVYEMYKGAYVLEGCFSPETGWKTAHEDSDCPQRPARPPAGDAPRLEMSGGRVLGPIECPSPKNTTFDLTLAEANLLIMEYVRKLTGQSVTFRKIEASGAFEVELDGDELPDRLYGVHAELWRSSQSDSIQTVTEPNGDHLTRSDNSDFESEGWWLLRRGVEPRRTVIVREVWTGGLGIEGNCHDLDRNGRFEVFVMEGGDSDRDLCLVQLSDGKLEPISCESGGD